MNYKAGFVTLVGIPNAGKSTITNILVGEKVSIVTNKPQTTRKRITGIVNAPNFQAILVDAPGVVESTTGLNGFLKAELFDALGHADSLLVLLNLDARTQESIEKVLDIAQTSKKPFSVLITKMDLNQNHRASVIRTKVENANIPYAEISNTMPADQLKAKIYPLIYNQLPASPAPLYPQDILTTENIKDVCAEMIREKCFEALFEEIPYQLAVQVRSYMEGHGLIKIYADILIEKDNQRKIVIGNGGSTLKKIGTAARVDIEKLVGKKVYLELHVKSRKNWYKDPMVLRELGYVVEKH